MERVSPKVLALVAAVVLSSAALGFLVEGAFSAGFSLNLSAWLRLVPLIISFGLATSLATVLALVGDSFNRLIGFALAAVGFGLPFFIPPNPVQIPILFALLLPLTFFGGNLLLDYYSRTAAKTTAIFSSSMFSTAYTRFFLFFVFALGFLVYFSTQITPQERFKIPEEVLTPALNLIVNRVIEQVQDQLGTKEFTEEQFIAELEKSGLLQVLEQQFGVTLNPSEIGSPQKLTENLRGPLVAQLTKDLDDLLEPYLPFLPLIAAVGAGISLLFLSPLFVYISVGAFAVVYRLLVMARLIYLAEEQRTVRVLKI